MKSYLFLLFVLIVAEVHAQTWQIAGNMPNPVQGGSAVVIDSVIYIIGGYNSQSNSNLDLIQSYDPRNDTWSVAAHSNFERYGLTAISYNDSIGYLGGNNSGGNQSTSIEFYNPGGDPEIFDNNSNFYREFAAGVVVGKYLYLFGGKPSLLNFNYWIKYDLSAKTVVDSSGFNFLVTPLTNQMAAADNSSNIYIFGGLYSVGGNSFLTKDINRFNLNSNNLLSVSNKLSVPRANGAAVYFGNNEIYIIGGFSETQTLSSIEIFNTNSKQIKSGPTLNVERKELMAVKYGNSIYVFGGSDKNNQTVQSFEKLDVITALDEGGASLPNDFKLYSNYPNPFNPSTIIKFSIARESFVTLKVYNILGEEISTLVNENKPAGEYKISFNSFNNGKQLESGVYIYRLRAGNFVMTKKMILLK